MRGGVFMSVQVGLSDLHYALLTADPKGGVPTYSTPVRFAGGAIQANINPNSSLETLFADDGPFEVSSSLGKIELELMLSDLLLEEQAVVLGSTYAGGVLTDKSTDTPPWLAIGFKTLKSNGKYRYVWLAKGKFSPPEMKHETKKETIAFQTPTIKASFAKRDSDDEWKKSADEDGLNYTSSIGTNWFNSPYAAADLVAPTVISTPLDAAAGVLTTATVIWTFNKAIDMATLLPANFFVMKADGTPVAGALTIDTAHEVVTFTPTAPLAALTDYIAIATVSVTSIWAVPLAAMKITNFTTA